MRVHEGSQRRRRTSGWHTKGESNRWFEGVALARPSYGKLQRCLCACVEARVLAWEGRVRGGLREASEGVLGGPPQSRQLTPRKRSSDERSGGLCRGRAWRLCYTVEPISGGPGRSGTPLGPLWDLRCSGDHFGAHSGGQFGGHFGIMLELILEVTLETCWSDPMCCDVMWRDVV